MVSVFDTKKEIGLILQDGNLRTPILDGKIVKVVVITNRVIETLRIKITSEELETIIDTQTNQIINIFYPYNDIARTTNETPFQDYYYINGTLNIKIIGLHSGDIIKQIKVFIA